MEGAAQTADRNGVGTLVLTHHVPAFPPGGGDDWRDLAAQHFGGPIALGDDLLRVKVLPTATAPTDPAPVASSDRTPGA